MVLSGTPVVKQVSIARFHVMRMKCYDLGSVYLQMVSTSMPENPKALSPSTQMTRCPGLLSLATRAAAIANPKPTPIVPKVPASSLLRTKLKSNSLAQVMQGGGGTNLSIYIYMVYEKS